VSADAAPAPSSDNSLYALLALMPLTAAAALYAFHRRCKKNTTEIGTTLDFQRDEFTNPYGTPFYQFEEGAEGPAAACAPLPMPCPSLEPSFMARNQGEAAAP